MTHIHLGLVLGELEKYTDRYGFNFQFWGKRRNHVYISKGGVDLVSFLGRESALDVLSEALNWVYRVNRVPHEKRIGGINPNF